MDVVALAQHGVGNAVATLGTATTPSTCRSCSASPTRGVLLRRRRRRPPRRVARARRQPAASCRRQAACASCSCPTEHDPDSFVREHGKDAFENAGRARRCRCREFLLERTALARRHAHRRRAGREFLPRRSRCVRQIAAPVLSLHAASSRSPSWRAGSADEIARLIGIRRRATQAARRRAARDRRAASSGRCCAIRRWRHAAESSTCERLLLDARSAGDRRPLLAISEVSRRRSSAAGRAADRWTDIALRERSRRRQATRMLTDSRSQRDMASSSGAEQAGRGDRARSSDALEADCADRRARNAADGDTLRGGESPSIEARLR